MIERSSAELRAEEKVGVVPPARAYVRTAVTDGAICHAPSGFYRTTRIVGAVDQVLRRKKKVFHGTYIRNATGKREGETCLSNVEHAALAYLYSAAKLLCEKRRLDEMNNYSSLFTAPPLCLLVSSAVTSAWRSATSLRLTSASNLAFSCFCR